MRTYIINKTKVLLPGKGNLSRLWLSCLGSFVLWLIANMYGVDVLIVTSTTEEDG